MSLKMTRIAAVFIVVAVAFAGVHFITSANSSKPSQEGDAALVWQSGSAVANISASAIVRSGEVADEREIPNREKEELMTPSELGAESAFVIDMSSGSEIFSIGKDKRWPLASLSKLMSATVALERMDHNKQVIMSETAIETEGSAGSLSVNESFSVSDLVAAMMVVSSNDAAVALSEEMPPREFTDAMNSKAEELGMGNTYFNEPSGLSSLNQSTPEDMSKLLMYAWKSHPELFVLSSKPKSYIKELTKNKRRELVNINPLAKRSNFLGGKTGFIEESRENLMAVFSFEKKPIGIIIFGSENRVETADRIISFLKNGDSRN
ncbi:MAG: serine hydrolase [Candidatus Colwellbacteria bacterium]|nr:serine hydrolase [Candidatus Colwellbacteria bacterium]